MRITTTGICAGCVVVLIGCGSHKPPLRPKQATCAQPAATSNEQCGNIELRVVNEGQLQLTRTRLRIDGERVKPGRVRALAGEHELAVDIEMSGVLWTAKKPARGAKPKPRRASARLRFAAAAGCTLVLRVRAQDPRRPNQTPRVRFTEALRCKNGFRAKASIPPPRPLPKLPPLKLPALRRWGETCMERSKVAQRYLDLAVEAMSERVVESCVHRKQRRVRQLRALIADSIKFVKRPSRAELRQDARMAQIACLRVLDLQAEAARCQ